MSTNQSKVYQQTPRAMFTGTAYQHSLQAQEAKHAYLQCQATAWLLLYESVEDHPEYERQAQQVVTAVLEVGTQEEWRESRTIMQQSIVDLRANRELHDYLHEEVLSQLLSGVDRTVQWRVVIEMIIQEAAIQLKKYKLWWEKTMHETRITYSPKETAEIFKNAGLVKESQKIGRGLPMVWEDPRKESSPKLCAPCRWLLEKWRGKGERTSKASDLSPEEIQQGFI